PAVSPSISSSKASPAPPGWKARVPHGGRPGVQNKEARYHTRRPESPAPRDTLRRMNIAHLLARAGRSYPERPAVALGQRGIADYRDLGRRSAALASALRGALGLAPGDRVGIFAKNCPQYVELLWASWWAGLAVVPINAKLHPKEAEFILDHSGA